MCTAFPLITPASPAVSAQAVKLPAGLLQLEVASESDLLSSDMSLEECLFLGPGLSPLGGGCFAYFTHIWSLPFTC